MPILNLLEATSILVAELTVYCGLFYLTGDIGPETKIIMFLIIVTSNAFFVGLWLLAICRQVFITLIDKFPRLARIFGSFGEMMRKSTKIRPEDVANENGKPETNI